MEALSPAARTSSGVDSPRGRGAGTTRLPRSAHRAAASALLALALAGCDPYLQGNGVYLEERRTDFAPFVGLHVEDGIDATVMAHAANEDVLVSGDANVVAWVRTEVETERGRPVLHVYVDERFGATIPLRAVIDAPSFEYVDATQGARVHVRDAATAHFTVVADQGSAIEVAGPGGGAAAGETISVELASGAALDARSYLVSQSAHVNLSGAASAGIRSDGPVTGTLANASALENAGSGDCSGVVRDPSSRVKCP